MSYWTQTKITDQYGFNAELTPMGEVRMAEPYRLVGSTFDGTVVDSNFWITGGAVAGAITSSGSMVTLKTTTGGANSSATLTSVRSARYVAGSSNRFRTVLSLSDTGEALNVRRWGVFTTGNGNFFQLSGTTMGTVTRRAGTDTVVTAPNWNTVTSFPTLTNVNTYETYWTNSKVYFVANDVLLHTASASGVPWTDSVTLPARLENINRDGLNTNHTLDCRVAAIARLGATTTQPTSKYQAGTTAGVICKIGAGNLHGAVIGGVVTTTVITVYDGLSTAGSILWSSGPITLGAQASNAPFYLDFGNIPFSTGLFLVISTANCNVTLVYE